MSNTSSESPVHFGKIGQVALTVTDLERSRNFYRDTLGMRFLFDAGNMAFFQCGETRFMIGASSKPAASEGTILYFMVTDIQAAHAYLKQQNVEFVQEPHLVAHIETHDLWIGFLKDPDGNVLGMMSEIPNC